jgi:hypothetical protein
VPFAPLAAAVFALPLLAGCAWFSSRQVDRTFIRSKAHLIDLLAASTGGRATSP